MQASSQARRGERPCRVSRMLRNGSAYSVWYAYLRSHILHGMPGQDYPSITATNFVRVDHAIPRGVDRPPPSTFAEVEQCAPACWPMGIGQRRTSGHGGTSSTSSHGDTSSHGGIGKRHGGIGGRHGGIGGVPELRRCVMAVKSCNMFVSSLNHVYRRWNWHSSITVNMCSWEPKKNKYIYIYF